MCAEQFNKISEIIVNIDKLSKGEMANKLTDNDLIDIKNNFEDAMNDDFNTPVAISEFIKFGRVASKILANNNENLAKEANILIKMFTDVLGFEFKCDTIESVDAEPNNEESLMNLISDIRTKLRSDKNYAMSDYIRDELSKLNINISDKKLK